jgi:hypothetical protein
MFLFLSPHQFFLYLSLLPCLSSIYIYQSHDERCAPSDGGFDSGLVKRRDLAFLHCQQ